MRLTSEQIQAIKQVAHTVLGAESRVILFGSRVDDARKGGDIDLLFETDHLLDNRATTIGKLYVALIRKLGDRKIDIILKDVATPGCPCAGDCTTNGHPVVSLKYLPEHASAVQLALDLIRKEADHLRYSQVTLFALPIDLAWVQTLNNRPEAAEKVEAFCSRFGRLQDHLGDKLLPRLGALVGENSKTLLDALAVAEKTELLSSADAFIAARRLRNALVHEYMHDAQTFLDSLFAAQTACHMFFDIIERAQAEIIRLGVPQTGTENDKN